MSPGKFIRRYIINLALFVNMVHVRVVNMIIIFYPTDLQYVTILCFIIIILNAHIVVLFLNGEMKNGIKNKVICRSVMSIDDKTMLEGHKD